MKKTGSWIAALALAGSLLIPTAGAAQAAEPDDVKITSLTMKDLVVSRKGCAGGLVTGTVEAGALAAEPGFEVVALLDVAQRGKTQLDAGLVAGQDGDVEGIVVWCPKAAKEGAFTGLGKFTAVVGLAAWFTDAEEDGVEFASTASATFTVKEGSKFASAKLTRKGKKRTFTAKVDVFSAAKQKRVPLAKKTKVSLQKKQKDGSWKTLKTVKVGSSGKLSTTVSSSSKVTLRFNYAGTSTKTPAISRALTK